MAIGVIHAAASSKKRDNDMARLKNKVGLITGAGSGIGAECARLMAREGAAVALTDLDADAVARVASEITSDGGRAISLAQDVVVEAQWESVLAQTREAFGEVSILVNNAGIAPNGEHVEEMDFEEWRHVIAVDLDSVFLGCKHGVRAMKTHGGSIINVSSIMGIVGNPGSGSYNAAKGGVRLLTKVVALECAQNGYAIRVNSIHPGYIKTPLVTDGVVSIAAREGEQTPEEVLEMITLRHPIGRMGQASEIANAVLFLASDEASFVTGTELVVDGGYTAQ